jgi:hypothetical protein
MNSILRNIIRKRLKESYQQEILDLVLDKISKYGVNSLNPHEKKILDDMSKNEKTINSDKDLLFHFLDFNIGKLKAQTYFFDKLAKKTSGINYFNKNKEHVFDLEIESEVLGVKKKPNFLYVNKNILDLIDKNFTIKEEDIYKIIGLWFEKETSIKPNKTQYFLTNKN